MSHLELIELGLSHDLVVSVIHLTPNDDVVFRDLRLEKSQLPLHFIESSDVSHKGPLEGVNVGIQLKNSFQCTKIKFRVIVLDVAKVIALIKPEALYLRLNFKTLIQA